MTTISGRVNFQRYAKCAVHRFSYEKIRLGLELKKLNVDGGSRAIFR
jgi:hypothetical protein